jgi:hypothetical protein
MKNIKISPEDEAKLIATGWIKRVDVNHPWAWQDSRTGALYTYKDARDLAAFYAAKKKKVSEDNFGCTCYSSGFDEDCPKHAAKKKTKKEVKK